MSKYHAHETVLATGPDRDGLPDAADFLNGMHPELHPLLIGPIHAPGDQHGARFASYVFLPDGEDSWDRPLLGGVEARDLFVLRLAEWLPDFQVVQVRYGAKPFQDDPTRFDAEVEDLR
ncbi:hypothetical protein [Micromonospora sediminicola]|uniref:hypothetical protein n=1 Tax=Micromonospora sediminicola TaxID=946078 RepID=UPI0037A59461